MSNSKKKPKPSTTRTFTAAPKPLSKLEQLPDELLLDIFAESENASLLFASPRLHEIANYTGTHKRLITLCCQDPRLRSSSRHHSHDNLRMLMQEKWLSLGWLWEAGCDWIAECVQADLAELVRVLEKSVQLPEYAKTSFDSMSQKFLADFRFARSGRHVHVGPSWTRKVRVLSTSGHDLEVYWDCSHDGNLSLSTVARIRDRGSAFHLPGSTRTIYSGGRPMHGFVNDIVNLQAFPVKFLEGPWTQSQGDILSFFMARVVAGSIRLSNRSRALAFLESGLKCALQNECLPALAVFGGNVADLLVQHLLPKTPETPIPPDHPVFQKTVNRSPWSKPNILVAEGTIPGLLWQADHVNMLLNKAIGRRRGNIWSKLVNELQSDLKARQGRNVAKATKLLDQIDKFWDVRQIDYRVLQAKILRAKSRGASFVLGTFDQ